MIHLLHMLYIIHILLSLYKKIICIRFFFPFTQVNSLFFLNFYTIHLIHMLFIFHFSIYYILYIFIL